MSKLTPLITLLLFLPAVFTATSNKKESAHSPEYDEHLCKERISYCRVSGHYTQCERSHGCSKMSHYRPNQHEDLEVCKEAAMLCEDILSECVKEDSIPGCTAEGYNYSLFPTPTPSPTPLKSASHPQEKPTSTPESSCKAMIDQCRRSNEYLSCRSDAGCATAHGSSNACVAADVACKEQLTKCVAFFFPDCISDLVSEYDERRIGWA